ncbi:MAG: DUF2963 domain-containing protein [Ruminiclostridium sp.]
MKKLSLLSIAVLVFILALFSGCSKEEYRFVKVETKEGGVIVGRSAENIEAFEGMNLIADDNVDVKEKSSALLLVDDDKHILAEENTEFSVNASGSKDNGYVTVDLVRGQALITIDNKLSENSFFKVRTLNATLSVRGTIFTVFYDDINNITYLDVQEGVVNVETTKNGITEDVIAGNKRKIENGDIEIIANIPLRNNEENSGNNENPSNNESGNEQQPVNEAGEKIHYYDDGTIWYIEEFNDAGNMIKMTYYREDGTLFSILECNSDGIKTKNSSYDTDELLNYTEEFDLDGRVIKSTFYNADGSVEGWIDNEYSPDGKNSKHSEYDGDGNIKNWNETEYNSDGKPIKDTYYDADGSLLRWYEYEFNSEGRLIKETIYGSDGTVRDVAEY